jgi:hypothetical protein
MIQRFATLVALLVVLCVCSAPSSAFAAGDASISIEPENPNPYSVVTLTLVSYSFNVNTATIIWSAGNKTLLAGTGEKKLSLRLGAVGERATIHVRASTATGETYDADVSITPASVDLVYETPESYVPPFYEGRSLPGEGANVRITALPSIQSSGAQLPPSSLSYEWYISGELIDSASGAGKQSALLPLDYLNSSTDIKVRVSSPSGVTAENSVTIFPHQVLPLTYVHDEVLGTDHSQLISRRFESTQPFTIALEPLYLSTKEDVSTDVEYSWLLDGLPITPTNGLLLSFQPKENSYGSQHLSISVSNNSRRLQTAETSLDLVFDTRTQ